MRFSVLKISYEFLKGSESNFRINNLTCLGFIFQKFGKTFVRKFIYPKYPKFVRKHLRQSFLSKISFPENSRPECSKSLSLYGSVVLRLKADFHFKPGLRPVQTLSTFHSTMFDFCRALLNVVEQGVSKRFRLFTRLFNRS